MSPAPPHLLMSCLAASGRDDRGLVALWGSAMKASEGGGSAGSEWLWDAVRAFVGDRSGIGFTSEGRREITDRSGSSCRKPTARTRPSSAGRGVRLRRTGLRRLHDLVLRDQRARLTRLRPPLAGRPEPGRHHDCQLEVFAGWTLFGGCPCQSVSTVGKRASLAPATCSGLWAHMAIVTDALC